jgi:hypothetical protein
MRLALLCWTGEGARPYTFRAHSLRVLFWTARVVFGRMYMLVIFYRFKMGYNFGRLAQCNGQAFFQGGRETMRFSDRGGVGK